MQQKQEKKKEIAKAEEKKKRKVNQKPQHAIAGCKNDHVSSHSAEWMRDTRKAHAAHLLSVANAVLDSCQGKEEGTFVKTRSK